MNRTYGVNAPGAQSRAAEKLGKNPPLISRCLWPTSKQGFRRIDEDLARQIEIAFALPAYSLDKGQAGGVQVQEPLAPGASLDDHPGKRILAAEHATLDEVRKLCELILSGLSPDMQTAIIDGAEDLTVPINAAQLRVLMELTGSTASYPDKR
ncbi:hypothetical protein I5Q65_29000 [Pseudomonas aeruginosa]|nr:hypothetical protein [Pseudomonas aeruginosa]EKX2800891.1 hypothetical protein [Pseudomonas aeruginosa]MBG5798852.1 hypothetical protein [Pseudomonas aeruginosa]MBH3773161.1 hypothetical protein [Pseudomonas aeruginosa]HCF2412287.1 hypothetical protein [Pseudomonas aeruginosa]